MMDQLGSYLAQCRVRSPLVEAEDAHYPPSKEETMFLLDYLKKQRLGPAISGSVGLLHHIGGDVKSFRPTYDLDIWVNKDPGAPPKGWRKDLESIGVVSWISPTGGYVDFMTPGHEFPGGAKTPRSVGIDTSFGYPVVRWLDLMRLKLNSMRAKDMTDLIALVRKIGKVPTAGELGSLNRTQRENLDMILQWFKARPIGGYGE